MFCYIFSWPHSSWSTGLFLDSRRQQFEIISDCDSMFKAIVAKDNSTEFYKNNLWLLLYKQGDHLEKTSQFISNAIHLTFIYSRQYLSLHSSQELKKLTFTPELSRVGIHFISIHYCWVMWDPKRGYISLYVSFVFNIEIYIFPLIFSALRLSIIF